MNAKTPLRRATDISLIGAGILILVAIVYFFARGPDLKLERIGEPPAPWSGYDFVKITSADRRKLTVRGVKLNGEFSLWDGAGQVLELGDSVTVNARSEEAPKKELIYLEVETDLGSARLKLDD